jgi:hypothetical protein
VVGNDMDNPLPPSKIEQFLSRLIDCHGFLIAFFTAPLIAVALSYCFSSRLAAVSLIFLLWCPFLFLLALYWGVQAIRKIRQSGGSLLATFGPCAALFATTVYLAYFSTRYLLGYQ